MIRALCGGPGRPLRDRHGFSARARHCGHGTATDRFWVMPVRIAACGDLRQIGVRSPSAAENYLSPERVARTAAARPAAHIGDKNHYAGDSPRLSAYRTRGGRLGPMSSGPPQLASSPPTVQRSLQRRDALARANDTRTQRAQLKRDLKAGRRSIQELLLNPPAFLEKAKVLEMLLAVPKYGRVKANAALTRCLISPNRTFGALSERQRAELASMLQR